MKTKYIAFGVGLVAGALLYNSNGPIKEECLTYQGYKHAGDGVNVAVFDDKPLFARKDSADLTAEYVRPEAVESLDIGKKYLVEFKEKELFGLPKLLSTSSCD